MPKGTSQALKKQHSAGLAGIGSSPLSFLFAYIFPCSSLQLLLIHRSSTGLGILPRWNPGICPGLDLECLPDSWPGAGAVLEFTATVPLGILARPV